VAEPLTDSPDGIEAKSRAIHPWRFVAFSIGCLLSIFLYLFLPPYVPAAFCPSGTFISGHMGSKLGILGCLLIFPSWLALTISAGVRSRNMKGAVTRSRLYKLGERRSVEFMIAAYCGLLVSAIVWVGYAGSYYCATPNAVVLHSGALKPAQVLSWSDVEVVHARCWAGSRSPWQGGLALSFANGEEILLRLGTRAAPSNRYYDPTVRAISTIFTPSCPGLTRS
jgi:hypothetical protein